MLINNITGERYQLSWLGANMVLVSLSTGLKRVITPSGETDLLFTAQTPGRQLSPKNRSEADLIPDLVRSLFLELKFLERRGQKIFLRFR